MKPEPNVSSSTRASLSAARMSPCPDVALCLTGCGACKLANGWLSKGIIGPSTCILAAGPEAELWLCGARDEIALARDCSLEAALGAAAEVDEDELPDGPVDDLRDGLRKAGKNAVSFMRA